MKGCTDRSSLAPKPPPTAVGMMRTCVGRDAENLRDVVAIHIGRLRAGLDFDAVADAAREAGLRLDIGVLDEAGLERALDDDVGRRERRRDVAARDAAAGQNIAGAARMDPLGAPAASASSSVVSAGSGLPRSPGKSRGRAAASPRPRRRPARPPRRESARRSRRARADRRKAG